MGLKMNKLIEFLIQNTLLTSFLILIVFAIRFSFRKLPKKYTYILWIIILVKLLIPVTINYELNGDSKIGDYAPTTIVEKVIPISAKEQEVAYQPPKTNVVVTPVQKEMDEFSVPKRLHISFEHIWGLMFTTLLIYSMGTYLFFRRKIRYSTKVDNYIYESDQINSGFILGFIKPKIYIPTKLSDKEKEYIIAHEQVHKNRFDYIIKPLFYLACLVYWFNPLVWFAFFAFVKDMEMSCDETVINKFSLDDKKDYSYTLLNIACRQNFVLLPVGFSNNSTKERIKNLFNIKKNKPILMGWALVVIILIGVILSLDFKEVEPVDSYKELYEFKNQYIGNATKSVAIASRLEYQKGLKYDHLKLDTGNEPYGLIIYLNRSEEIKKYNLDKQVLTLHSLIENLDYVKFVIGDLVIDYQSNSALYEDELDCYNQTDTLEKYKSFLEYYSDYDILETYSSNIIFDTKMIAPVHGKIIMQYGYTDPTNNSVLNPAVIFSSSPGKSVYAVYEGVVEFSGWNDERGWEVIIEHGNSYRTVYSNLEPETLVKVGTEVKQGDIIGNVRFNESSSESQLRFSITVDNIEVNPNSDFEEVIDEVEIAINDGFVWPTKKSRRINAHYGYYRPFGETIFHTGMDIGGDLGDSVINYHYGKVTNVGYDDTRGNFIEITHDDNIKSVYQHLDEVLVKEGDVVKTAQEIGKMGKTGQVTGVHLHFEIHIDGQTVNPYMHVSRW